MPYKIIVIETSDVVARVDPKKPCLYVGIHSSDQIKNGLPDDLKEWVSRANPKPRSDLAPNTVFNRRARAVERRKKLSKSLRRQGFTVNKSRQVWSLYVIELKPDPRVQDKRPAVYVGQTSKAIEERFQQHKIGGYENKASKVVTRRWVELKRSLIPRGKYYTKEDAEAAETRLGKSLEAKGYRVYGPQGMD